jgi:hypothetical protein
MCLSSAPVTRKSKVNAVPHGDHADERPTCP